MHKSNEEERFEKNSVSALVIYDISNTRKRMKFAKLLTGYGLRIQRSAFEISVSRGKFSALLRQIPQFCDTEDSIRVYKLTKRNEVLKWGKDLSREPEAVIIV